MQNVEWDENLYMLEKGTEDDGMFYFETGKIPEIEIQWRYTILLFLVW